MQAARWVDKDFLTQKQREQHYKLHLQRVAEINHHKRSHTAEMDVTHMQESIMHAKAFNIHFNTTQRNQAIGKGNRCLLQRLLSIQQGRQRITASERSPFRINSEPTEKLASNKIALELKRHQESLQVAQENRAIAQRILAIKPIFSRDQIKSDISQYEKMKEQLQKVKLPCKLNNLPLLPSKSKLSSKSQLQDNHSNIERVDPSSTPIINKKKKKRKSNRIPCLFSEFDKLNITCANLETNESSATEQSHHLSQLILSRSENRKKLRTSDCSRSPLRLSNISNETIKCPPLARRYVRSSSEASRNTKKNRNGNGIFSQQQQQINENKDQQKLEEKGKQKQQLVGEQQLQIQLQKQKQLQEQQNGQQRQQEQPISQIKSYELTQQNQDQ